MEFGEHPFDRRHAGDPISPQSQKADSSQRNSIALRVKEYHIYLFMAEKKVPFRGIEGTGLIERLGLPAFLETLPHALLRPLAQTHLRRLIQKAILYQHVMVLKAA